MGRLLVSVRGPNEALAAAEGGAHIADVEYPASALGTPYPLNIRAARQRLDDAGFKGMPISTNIGEEQSVRSTACQAALGVAVAGADYIKFGLAGFNLKSAVYLGRNLVRTVREWFPTCKVYPAVFPEEEFAACLDPLTEGPTLVEEIDCDGLLIDTFDKNIGKGLLDQETFLRRMGSASPDAHVLIEHLPDELVPAARDGLNAAAARAGIAWDDPPD